MSLLSSLFVALKNVVKSALADDNNEFITVKSDEWGVEAKVMLHDTVHLQVACLDPISVRVCEQGQWKVYQVDGISGVSIPEFGREGLPAEYDGELDEARVGIHQWFQDMTRPIYCVRAIYWCFFLTTQYKANCIQVVLDHWHTIKSASFDVRIK